MRTKYAAPQIFLHWLVLIFVILAYASMELKGFFPKGSDYRAFFSIFHFSLGFSILVLMIVRLLIKQMYIKPGITPEPPVLQKVVAKITHGLIYVMFISLPILGILSLYFSGNEWSLFGINMPESYAPDIPLQKKLKSTHEFIANTGYYIIGLHVAASLFHHYFLHDNTLIRMLPRKK